MSNFKITISGTDDMDRKIQALKEAVAEMPPKKKGELYEPFELTSKEDGVTIRIFEEEEQVTQSV
jgi:hypothetical protein